MSPKIKSKITTPIPLQILAWLLIIGGSIFVLKIIFLGSDFTLARGSWNALVKFLAIVSGVGFLKLKKWAVYLYFGTFSIATAIFYIMPPNQQILEIYTQPSSSISLFFVPTSIAIIVWKYWNKFHI